MIFALHAAAFAVDTDYSGELDTETYEPLSESGISYNRTLISDTLSYDWNSHDYVYTVEDHLLEVHASVADGMVVSGPVAVNAGGDQGVIVFCNGEETTEELSNLREAGEYIVSLRSAGSSLRLFDFMIVGDTTKDLNTFTVPDGFYIKTATRDGLDIYEDHYRVSMEEEGDYVIEYECGPTEIPYTLATTIDRTPPSLSFRGKVDSKQRVHSALSFSGLQNGDTVVLLRDGSEAHPIVKEDGTGQIIDSGNYIMRVYDAAGNMQEYKFTIMTYFNAGSWFFFSLVLAVIIAVAAYIIIKRKRLKIG